MWNKKDRRKESDDKNEGPLSIIAPKTVLAGNLDVADNLKVDGKIKGDIRCCGKLVISVSGIIEGNVWCAQADVYGKVVGNLICQGALQIYPDAVLRGNINTAELDVDQGASVQGLCEVEAVNSEKQLAVS